MFFVHVYLTHDNSFAMKLFENGTPIDLVSTGVTRMVIKYGTALTDVIDSDDEGAGAGQPFDWTTDGEDGIVEFNLGDVSIDAGSYTCKLIVYDPLHPDGQVMDDKFKMVIHSQVA